MKTIHPSRALLAAIPLVATLGVAVTGCTGSSSTASSAAAASSAPALAGAVKGTCTTTISNQTVGSVLVPSGQTCTLNNVTVTGDITIYGTLQLTTTAAIGGNVMVEPNSTFTESGPTSVAIDKNFTVNAAANWHMTLDNILGNATVENTYGSYWNDNFLGGSLFWLNNGGDTTIYNNTVNGSIICSGNSTAPTNNGKPNKVHGHETGQCAGLH
jgi:5'-nucleotidase